VFKCTFLTCVLHRWVAIPANSFTPFLYFAFYTLFALPALSSIQKVLFHLPWILSPYRHILLIYRIIMNSDRRKPGRVQGGWATKNSDSVPKQTNSRGQINSTTSWQQNSSTADIGSLQFQPNQVIIIQSFLYFCVFMIFNIFLNVTNRRPLKIRTEGNQSWVRKHGCISFFAIPLTNVVQSVPKLACIIAHSYGTVLTSLMSLHFLFPVL